ASASPAATAASSLSRTSHRSLPTRRPRCQRTARISGYVSTTSPGRATFLSRAERPCGLTWLEATLIRSGAPSTRESSRRKFQLTRRGRPSTARRSTSPEKVYRRLVCSPQWDGPCGPHPAGIDLSAGGFDVIGSGAGLQLQLNKGRPC